MKHRVVSLAHAPTVRRVGSIADYDPVNDNYGSLTLGYHPTSRTNSMTQEWEESIPISPSAAAGGDLPGQSYVPGWKIMFTRSQQHNDANYCGIKRPFFHGHLFYSAF